MKKGTLALILILLLALISCDNKNKVEDILIQSEETANTKTISEQSEIANNDNKDIIYNNYYELDNKLFTFINHMLKKDYLLKNYVSGMNSNLYKNGHYYEDEYKIGEYYDTGFRDGIINFSIIDLDFDNINEVIIYKFKKRHDEDEEPEKRINYIEVYKWNNGIYEKICDKELVNLCDISLYDIKYGYINDNNKSYISIDLNKKNSNTNENICNEHILYEFNNNNFVESNDNVDREKVVLLNNMYNEINNDIQKKHTVYSEHNNTYNNRYNINFVKRDSPYNITKDNYKNIILDLCLTDAHIFYPFMGIVYSSLKHHGVVVDNYNENRQIQEYDSIKVVDELCDYDNCIVTVECTIDNKRYYYVLKYGLYHYASGWQELTQISIIYKDTIMPKKEYLNGYYGKKYSIDKLKTNDIRDIKFYENSTSVDCMDSILYGKFEQDNNIDNGKEDIEWILLGKKDNKALLLSKYVLYASCYGENSEWDNSYVRKWLNNDFINTAFSDNEKNILYNMNNDKVFLLSIEEAATYFSPFDDIGRITTKATEYAKNQEYKVLYSDKIVKLNYCDGGSIYDVLFEGNTDYWLKDSCMGPDECTYDGFWNAYVSENGYLVDDEGAGSYDSLLGLRPAIWVDLEKI